MEGYDPETPYGSYLAVHLAIGALFLGCEIDVRIFNTNTSRIFVETVELDRNGDFKQYGNLFIPSVKTSGSEKLAPIS
jgi:2-methylaconitate cis-trans-isomerase PrpF